MEEDGIIVHKEEVYAPESCELNKVIS